MASNDTSKADASSPANSPQSPPPKESSSPPPKAPPPQESSPPPQSSSPPPSSPPPSSPPPSSPPPSSPPPSSPPPSDDSLSPPPSPPSPSEGSSPSPPSTPHAPSSQSPPPEAATPPSNSTWTISSPAAPVAIPSPKPSNPGAAFSPPPSVTANKSSSPAGSNDGSFPSSSSSQSSGSSSRDLLVGGVTAASIILIVLLVACVACVVCSSKKKKKGKEGSNSIPYTWKNGSTPSKGGKPYRSTPQGIGHALKIPPPPGGWGQQAGPPHMMGSSSEMTSSYSGRISSTNGPPSPGLQLAISKSMFTLEELSASTNGFAPSNVLGQGGFGVVHKGILPNGKEIAVKSLKAGSGQGQREFQSEVEIISRVHHRHLVSLVGYSISGAQRMLVYEYVPNNNLEYHLHQSGNPPLDFSTRLRVALGSAKGLAYLHEDCHPRIIHRDIKASNILIDFSFEAQVADFGLAKLTTETNTHISTRVMGTFGYLAPEYAASGKLTEKSDVFSFGVMLLELITGRRPVDPKMKYMEDSLVDWARPLLSKALEDGNYNEIADPCLERIYNPHEMLRMVACAAACIRHSAKKRPKMSQIVRALEGDVSLDDLNDIAKPGLSSVYSSTTGSSDYDTKQYSADLKKFRQMAFATVEFGSEYGGGGTTSEYGLNPSTSSDDSSWESSRKF